MKATIIILMVLMSVSLSGQDQVYITQWSSEAQRDIIFVDNPMMADLVVNVVASPAQLHLFRNTWYFTRHKHDADIVCRVVTSTNGNRRAIRVYRNTVLDEYKQSKWDRSYYEFKQNLYK